MRRPIKYRLVRSGQETKWQVIWVEGDQEKSDDKSMTTPSPRPEDETFSATHHEDESEAPE